VTGDLSWNCRMLWVMMRAISCGRRGSRLMCGRKYFISAGPGVSYLHIYSLFQNPLETLAVMFHFWFRCITCSDSTCGCPLDMWLLFKFAVIRSDPFGPLNLEGWNSRSEWVDPFQLTLRQCHVYPTSNVGHVKVLGSFMINFGLCVSRFFHRELNTARGSE
jgi:hypothetical protein